MTCDSTVGLSFGKIQDGPRETDGFLKIVALIVLNKDNFYLHGNEGNVILFKLLILSSSYDSLLVGMTKILAINITFEQH